MKTLLIILVAMAAGVAAAADGKVMEKSREQVADFAVYQVPAGWTASAGASQGDPSLTLTRDMHTITVRLAGGPGSRYKRAADFLVGFGARSPGGKLPEKIASLPIAGVRTIIYRRQIAVSLPDPDKSGPSALTAEEFCVVQAGKRFFIFSYSYGDTVPDPGYDGNAAWRKFLRSFRIKKK